MKNLILVAIASMFSVSVSAAVIQCAEIGSGSYPVSVDAIKLADHLKVKTCDGKKFKAAAAQLKQTIENVPASSELIASTQKRKDEKLGKAVTKKLSGFSF